MAKIISGKKKENNRVSLEEKKLELALSPFEKPKEIEECMQKKMSIRTYN
jgi:hypothetical protein